MTSPALICPTCRAAFDLEAAAKSSAPLRECCYAALVVAQAHCIVANAVQTFVIGLERVRPFAADLSDEAVTSQNPKVRAAAVAWRIARGRNREAERWVHQNGKSAGNWLCGATHDGWKDIGKPVTCPYCLGAMAIRQVRT